MLRRKQTLGGVEGGGINVKTIHSLYDLVIWDLGQWNFWDHSLFFLSNLGIVTEPLTALICLQYLLPFLPSPLSLSLLLYLSFLSLSHTLSIILSLSFSLSLSLTHTHTLSLSSNLSLSLYHSLSLSLSLSLSQDFQKTTSILEHTCSTILT